MIKGLYPFSRPLSKGMMLFKCDHTKIKCTGARSSLFHRTIHTMFTSCTKCAKGRGPQIDIVTFALFTADKYVTSFANCVRKWKKSKEKRWVNMSIYVGEINFFP
ncbi:hypothetical protein POVCU2_0041070 [Plasmodium ovale curtisi]|uniref:Uncharacterized protein n=1 Tax=Plasmodium ovale curtisi TaxID=864141 RepID=A0A1A8W637_PLAOA|nr:hypothetical protein POVCU2_0041070 [Plasmodium ovale curtisi]SBS97401.1 hypothetical protein POVCU1_037920 [Plasmodium ovale curtisi]